MQDDATEADGTVTVSENGLGPYGQTINAGDHVVNADEPEPNGRDGGPDPYQLFLAALGSCTSMTVRMYARRKDWPLEHVEVTLRHRRVYAKDCEDCESGNGLIDRIEKRVRLRGPLSDEQRERLLDIADKCPVHRTLTTETVIDTVHE